MTSYFADTSFLIDLLRAKEEAVEIQRKLQGTFMTGTICIFELCRLASFDPEPVIQNPVVSFTTRDAEKAGEIERELTASGEKIGKIDLLIAAQAMNQGAVLVTRDQDFRKIRGLETEYY